MDQKWGFELATDDNPVTINSIVNQKDNTTTRINYRIYLAKKKNATDNQRYVCVGKDYANIFMTLEEFSARAEIDSHALDQDLAAEKPHVQTWTPAGDKDVVSIYPPNDLPKNLFVFRNIKDMPSAKSLLDKYQLWKAKSGPPPNPLLEVYKKKWAKIAKSASTFSAAFEQKGPHDPSARYFQDSVNPPLNITFAPLGDWPDPTVLQTAVNIAFAGNKSYIPQVVAKDSNPSGYLTLSTNALGFYKTMMPEKDLERLLMLLVAPSAGGAASMIRDWPNAAQLKYVNDIVESKGQKRFQDETILALSFAPSTAKGPDRKDLNKLMGVSANKWASDGGTNSMAWPASKRQEVEKPTKGVRVAEWLHRSAHSLGKPDNLALADTPENLMFSTWECNTNMMRAENSIKMLRERSRIRGVDLQGSDGKLTTEVVVSTAFRAFETDGKQHDIPIPANLRRTLNAKAAGGYSWLIPELDYVIRYPLQVGGLLQPAIGGITRLQTFNRYFPPIVEVNLDTELIKQFVKVMAITAPRGLKRPASADPNTSSSSGTKKAPDPSASLTGPKVVATSSVTNITPSAGVGTKVLSTATPVAPLAVAPPKAGVQGPLPTLPLPTVPPSAPPRGAPATTTSVNILNPANQAIWQQMKSNASAISIDGTKVIGPKTLKDPNAATHSNEPMPEDPPAGGFVVTGQIKLFGIDKLTVNFSSWHGPPPEGATVSGAAIPVYQHVEIETLSIVDIAPLLAKSAFEKFPLKQAVIMYQNTHFIKTKAIGWHLDADIVIDEKFGAIHDILTKALKVPNTYLDVHVSSALGLGHTWNEIPGMYNFGLEGILQLKQADGSLTALKLADGLMLTKVGVRLLGIGTHELGLNAKPGMKDEFEIFGEMQITVPGSVTPLVLDFSISEFEGAAQLTATVQGDVWKNALGSGFDLVSVSFSTSFEIASPLQSFSFAVGAFLTEGSTIVSLAGTYTHGGAYSVTASVENFGMVGIADIFTHLTGGVIPYPTAFDIEIGAASINIANTGVVVKVDNLKIDNYASVSAQVSFDGNGATVRGSIPDQDFDELKLEEAIIQVSFQKSTPGHPGTVDLILGGTVDFLNGDAKVSAAVHLYKASPDAKSFDWTVYGTFLDDKSSGGLPLAKFVPGLKDAPKFLRDLALQEAMLIVASRNDPELSSMNPQKYPIQQGVQLCAVLGEIDNFKSLLRTPSAPVLTLAAAWSKSVGFVLEICLPTPIQIHLGKGITTDPITMQISTKPIGFMIYGGLKVPVPHSPDPLDFRASLALEDEDVVLAAELDGYWIDPFGISPEVEIGPHLGMQLDINLPLFLATGTPTGLAFDGAMKIGDTSGAIAVSVSEDPMQELLSGSLKNLTIGDLVKFVGTVIDHQLPPPPDFLDFEELELYVSTGVMIGTQSYPAGFSFDAKMKVFGAEMESKVAITGGQLTVHAEIDDLKIGPLEITGATGKNATFDLTVGATTQKLQIDGAIDFLGIMVSLLVDCEILPTPQFSFDFLLTFTDLLLFRVDAKMVGATDLKDFKNLDFYLSADLEQHLLEYVRTQVIAYLENVRKKSQGAIAGAEDAVNKAEQQYQQDLKNKQADLDASYAAWQKKSAEVHAASQKKIDDYNVGAKALQAKVDLERQKYDLALKKAEGDVQHANADRAAKLRDAEAKVTKAQTDWDKDVAKAKQDVEDAKKRMEQKFGAAEQSIQHAEDKVNSLQNQINSLQGQINSDKNAHWYEVWKKIAIPGLEIAIGGVWLAKEVADGVLKAANAIVQGADFVAAKAAIPAAEAALAATQKAGDITLQSSKAFLQGVDKTTAALVSATEETLKEIQNGGDAVLRGAERALAAFVDAGKVILEAAQAAIDGLIKAGEWIAYQTATAALAVAKAATHTLDVAKLSLEAAKVADNLWIDIAEDVVKAITETLDITEIKMSGSLKGILGKGGQPFSVTVKAIILGKPVGPLTLTFTLGSVGKFIEDLLKELVKK